MNNQQALESNKPVSGMLLYAKTSEGAPQPAIWKISGHDIAVRVLDLAKPFADIARQLDEIAAASFGAKRKD